MNTLPEDAMLRPGPAEADCQIPSARCRHRSFERSRTMLGRKIPGEVFAAWSAGLRQGRYGQSQQENGNQKAGNSTFVFMIVSSLFVMYYGLPQPECIKSR
jgi:hypothetical protein